MSQTYTATSMTNEHQDKIRDTKIMFIVGAAHAMSHFAQFILPRLTDWVTVSLKISVTQLSVVVMVFYIVSCLVQTTSGFIVDKKGGRPILLFGLSFIALGLSGYALSTQYWMLLASAVFLGIGNGVFHPVDYTLINKLVKPKRISYAYSVHGMTGNLGWALAPVFVVGIAKLTDSWRIAIACSVALVVLVLLVCIYQRQLLALPVEVEKQPLEPKEPKQPAEILKTENTESIFAFLKLPAIWFCMLFFFFYALNGGAILVYSPQAVQGLFGMGEFSAATCVTVFMIASAVGMAYGGHLASDPSRCEKIVAFAFGISAVFALMMAFLPLSHGMVFVMFALIGFFTGIAGPSRDLIVKRATPEGASGRVFGVVYAGLDIGQAISPLLYGLLIDHKQYAGIFITLAIVQVILISSAFTAGKQSKAQK